MLALAMAITSPSPFVASEVKKPVSSAGVSTPLDTNGEGKAEAALTALEAERAFAEDARKDGQWTAFRRWAAKDAIMFFPEPGKVQERLKDATDPPRAIRWSPASSYVSCDGTMAVNTGPWERPDGRVGYFSTIWQRQPDTRWKWTLDAGDTLATARWQLNSEPRVRRAACGSKPTPPPEIAFFCAAQAGEKKRSADGTLAYFWYIMCGGGSRSLIVWLWAGSGWQQVIHDHVVLSRRP